MASATDGSPIAACQAVGGSWLAIKVDARSLRSSITSSKSRRSASVSGGEQPIIDRDEIELRQQPGIGAFAATDGQLVQQVNHERPHQALEMATPASRYQPSARVYQGLEELEYPHHDWTAVITTCGRICYQRRRVNVSQVFAGQKVGVKQTDDHIWLVTFMDYDLGTSTTRRAVSNRSIIRSVQDCYRCLRNRVSPMSPEWTLRKVVGATGFEPATPCARQALESFGSSDSRMICGARERV
jgi:hypothetical protein